MINYIKRALMRCKRVRLCTTAALISSKIPFNSQQRFNLESSRQITYLKTVLY